MNRKFKMRADGRRARMADARGWQTHVERELTAWIMFLLRDDGLDTVGVSAETFFKHNERKIKTKTANLRLLKVHISQSQ